MSIDRPCRVTGLAGKFRECGTRSILLALLLTQAPGLAQAQQFRKALFPHRSVGDCFWDRSRESCLTPPTTISLEVGKYNAANGLSGSNAVSMDELFNEPSPANDWADWDHIFGGVHPESAALYGTWLKAHPIFIVKTGYPAGQYMNEADSLPAYQNHFRSIISHMRDHPENFFVITTNYPAATDKQGLYRSAQSSQFSDWAKTTLAEGNDSFGPFPPNVYVLDWFHMIASDVDGYCPPEYGSVSEESNLDCPGPGGDHPSNAAVAVIDPQFVQQIFDAAIAYEGHTLAATWAGPPALTGNLANRVQVTWQTLTEINTFRFYVQRNGGTWKTIDSVNAGGTSLSSRHYAVNDTTVTAGTWVYRIKEADLDGSVHFSPTVSTTILADGPGSQVTAYALDQNYPNPFNPGTNISYALPHSSYVTITVYDMLGQKVTQLVDEFMAAGYHSVLFDGSRFASGAYYYRMLAGDFVMTKRLTLIR